MTEEKREEIDKSFLVKTLLGVSPIPVVGEIALSWLFYDLLRPSGFKNVGIPAALLTRHGMYMEFYLPLFDKARELF